LKRKAPALEFLAPVGLKPYKPQKFAGILKDPNKSPPIPIGEHSDDINPPSPPLDPPADLFGFHGFLELPQISLLASRAINPYGTFDFINGIPPYSLKT
jgi:hypothetical protein